MANFQTVTVDSSLLKFNPGELFTLPLIYNTSDSNAELSGITLNIHYNSSVVTPNESSTTTTKNNGVTDLNTAIFSNEILNDTTNLDNDAATDKYIGLIFLDILSSKFPGSPLPKIIGKVNFTPSANFTDNNITLNLTATQTAAGYEFQKYPIPLTKIQAIPVNDGAATFSVSGTPTVGQVLTVAKTTDDPDGNGTFSYQWQSSSDGSTWANIGANAVNYTLTSAEQAKQIRVQVSYIDAQAFTEKLTVAAGTVAAIDDGDAAFSVSGTPTVGQVLTVAKTTDDPDGNGTFSYQWQSSTDGSTWANIGANAVNYTLTSAEQAKQIRVQVSYIDAQAFTEKLTVDAGTVGAIDDGDAAFSVSGTPTVGQVLTVAKTTDDPDGNGTFSYQWQSSTDGSTWASIGANAVNYTLTSAEQAKQIRVQVSYTDAQAFTEKLTVAAGTVGAIDDGDAAFSVSGTPTVGQVLTVAKTTDDPDGNGTFSYQWQSSTDGSTWANIGANAVNYTLTSAEQAKQIRVQVSYIDAQAFTEKLTVAAGTVAAIDDGDAAFSVSGTPTVGQVLTVAKTTDDPDGNGTFSYQWQSSTDGSTWASIGANAVNYTLTSAEQAKQIRVQVSYIDAQAFTEKLTVAAGTVAAIDDGDAAFSVSGTPTVGQVLTVAKTTDDPDGNGTFSYQWQSSTDGSTWASIGANAVNYTLTSAEQAKQIRVQVSYTDAQAFTEKLTVAAGTVAAIDDGDAAFSVSGTPTVGQVLTVAKTTDDPDGNGTFSYQWQSSSDGSTWANIGANAVNYTLTSAEQAKQIRVQVSYIDAQAFTEKLTVDAGTVAAIDDGDAAFSVSGTRTVGQVLTVAKTTDDPDGNGTFSYQWQSSTDGSTWANIGANAVNYTLTSAEQAKQIRVQVSYIDAQAFTEKLTVAAGTVGAIDDGDAAFSVSGTPTVGQVLTVAKTTDDPDGNGTFSYQWQSSTDGSTWASIGANAVNYTLTSAEQAKQIRVQVSYTDAQAFTEKLTVAAGTVGAIDDGDAAFSVSGTPTVGQVLTVAKTTDDPDGNGTFSYQWQSSTDGSTWANIGANAVNYTLTSAEQAKQIRVQVSYIDAQAFTEKLTVAAGTVAAIDDGDAAFSVSGTPTVGQVLTVAKTTDDPDGNGTFSYQWQSSTDGSTWASIGANAVNYTLTSAEQAKQIRVQVSYIDAQAFTEKLTVAGGYVPIVKEPKISITGNYIPSSTLTAGVELEPSSPYINSTFTYTWYANKEIIAAQTTRTLDLTDDFVGKRIRATASYTDYSGKSASVTTAEKPVQAGFINSKGIKVTADVRLENANLDGGFKTLNAETNPNAKKAVDALKANKVELSPTLVNFTIALSPNPTKPSENQTTASIAIGIDLVSDGIALSTGTGAAEKQTPLSYYSVDSAGVASPFTYDPVSKTGANFYDTNFDGKPDLVTLAFVDGGRGDKDGLKNGKILDPSTAATVNVSAVLANFKDSLLITDPLSDLPAALIVKAKLTSRATTVNEIGYVILDKGETIDSIGFAGLTARAQILFAGLESSDVPNLSSFSFDKSIALVNGQSIRFFETTDSSFKELAAGKSSVAALGSSFKFLSTTIDSSTTKASAASSSGINFSLEITGSFAGLGSLIGVNQADLPILDFSALAGMEVTADLFLAREASYNSSIGFYKILGLDGSVRDSISGNVFLPGDGGYTKAALSNKVTNLKDLSIGNQQNTTNEIKINETGMLAPYAIVSGVDTYFAFTAANPDLISHFKVLGTNVIGLEDISGGGDKDFDDVVIAIKAKTLTAI